MTAREVYGAVGKTLWEWRRVNDTWDDFEFLPVTVIAHPDKEAVASRCMLLRKANSYRHGVDGYDLEVVSTLLSSGQANFPDFYLTKAEAVRGARAWLIARRDESLSRFDEKYMTPKEDGE